MIEEYAHVRIKSTNILGVVVDIYTLQGKTIYTVEGDDEGVPGGWGEEGSFKLFACLDEDLELC